jgi:phosphatidylinositol alpha-1,6-mannosyltransferase
VRVLIITFDPPGNPGGIEGRAEAYVSNLQMMGHFVEMLSFERVDAPSEGKIAGASLYRLPLKPTSVSSAIAIAARDDIDGVFFLSGGASLMGLILLTVFRIGKKRSLLLFYGRDLLRIHRNPLGRLMVASATLLSGAAAANSAFTATLFRRESTKRAFILYPGVNPRLPELLGAPSAQHDTNVVLFVGRLVPRKCADVLIEAFADVERKLPGARLEIVGDGPEMQRLKRLTSQLDLDDWVDFSGTLTGKPLWRTYANCDLLVLPSRSDRYDVEGFGTVFLEAAVFGKPSIGTKTGGIPEAIVNNVTGVLIDSPEPAELSRAITSLLTDAEWRRHLGEEARTRALSHFTWEQSTRTLLLALKSGSSCGSQA